MVMDGYNFLRVIINILWIDIYFMRALLDLV
jgi:hypothetical protein